MKLTRGNSFNLGFEYDHHILRRRTAIPKEPKCYDTLNQHKAKAAIPPRKGARIWQHGNRKAERHVRDQNLRRIRKVGRKQWKIESDYHRRSLAETTVFRFKTIFGDRLQTRRIENQFKELLLKTSILNQMTHLGMPDTIKIAD